MRHPQGVTVTLIDRTVDKDRYGNETVTETRTDIPGCAVAPRSEGETVEQGRAGVIIGVTAYLPAGVDVDAADAIEIDGRTYQVDGMPGTWRNPFTGWDAGVEVALRRAEG